jgi:hypothetical protein
MSLAGDNEKIFRLLFSETNQSITLLGKKVFHINEVTISVDESFKNNDIEYLVEIDSGNMAKLIVGQYVLLNELYNGCKDKAIFVVIHFYKDYKPERTIKNLDLVNTNLYNNKGIKYIVLHINDIKINNQISIDSIK